MGSEAPAPDGAELLFGMTFIPAGPVAIELAFPPGCYLQVTLFQEERGAVGSSSFHLHRVDAQMRAAPSLLS